MTLTRRSVVKALGSAAALTGLPASLRAAGDPADPADPYVTPYKYPKLVLGPSALKAVNAPHDASEPFDSRGVDDPIVFRAKGAFYMLYIGFDGTGYQTGLARSKDLLQWERVALVGPRDQASTYTKYNLAISSILRDKNLHGTGEALKVNGDYLAAWNAYPGAGYESGAAVIGLARSKDLLHWTLTEPILHPEDGAPWEHGGLYRPDLMLDGGTYFVYYNAKTDTLPKSEGGGWHEQSGVATSTDLKQWTRYAGNPLLRNGARGSLTYGAGASGECPADGLTECMPDAYDSRFASNPYVMKNGSEYAMFYFGLGYRRPGHARELLALGSDPYHFTKVNAPIIDAGKPGSLDETHAHKPSVIFHEGMLYHFYCAVSGKWPNETRGIAVARSKPWPGV